MIFTILILSYFRTFGECKSQFPQSINVALETVVDFDKKDRYESLNFINEAQTFLNKLKYALDDNVQYRKFYGPVDDNDYKFTDFLQDTLETLAQMKDHDLEHVKTIFDDEIRKYHYKGSRFHELTGDKVIRRFMSNNLDKVRKTSARDIKRALNYILMNIADKNLSDKNRNLLEFINLIYRNSNRKLKSSVKKLESYSKSRDKNIDLEDIVKKSIKDLIFDHYSKLNFDERKQLKIKALEFIRNFVEKSEPKEVETSDWSWKFPDHLTKNAVTNLERETEKTSEKIPRIKKYFSLPDIDGSEKVSESSGDSIELRSEEQNDIKENIDLRQNYKETNKKQSSEAIKLTTNIYKELEFHNDEPRFKGRSSSDDSDDTDNISEIKEKEETSEEIVIQTEKNRVMTLWTESIEQVKKATTKARKVTKKSLYIIDSASSNSDSSDDKKISKSNEAFVKEIHKLKEKEEYQSSDDNKSSSSDENQSDKDSSSETDLAVWKQKHHNRYSIKTNKRKNLEQTTSESIRRAGPVDRHFIDIGLSLEKKSIESNFVTASSKKKKSHKKVDDVKETLRNAEIKSKSVESKEEKRDLKPKPRNIEIKSTFDKSNEGKKDSNQPPRNTDTKFESESNEVKRDLNQKQRNTDTKPKIDKFNEEKRYLSHIPQSTGTKSKFEEANEENRDLKQTPQNTETKSKFDKSDEEKRDLNPTPRSTDTKSKDDESIEKTRDLSQPPQNADRKSKFDISNEEKRDVNPIPRSIDTKSKVDESYEKTRDLNKKTRNTDIKSKFVKSNEEKKDMNQTPRNTEKKSKFVESSEEKVNDYETMRFWEGTTRRLTTTTKHRPSHVTTKTQPPTQYTTISNTSPKTTPEGYIKQNVTFRSMIMIPVKNSREKYEYSKKVVNTQETSKATTNKKTTIEDLTKNLTTEGKTYPKHRFTIKHNLATETYSTTTTKAHSVATSEQVQRLSIHKENSLEKMPNETQTKVSVPLPNNTLDDDAKKERKVQETLMKDIGGLMKKKPGEMPSNEEDKTQNQEETTIIDTAIPQILKPEVTIKFEEKDPFLDDLENDLKLD